MRETETFTGMIVKKRKTLFGKYTLTLSDTRRSVTVDCGERLYDCFCEGIQLTIVRYGDQLVSWHPASGKDEQYATSIAETADYRHGKVLYYRSSRCMNTPDLRGFNKGLLTGDEIVSFDCNLFEQLPVQPAEIEVPCPEHQYLAVIIEPDEHPNTALSQDGRFSFCGYDLVEEQTQISAITDCGAGYCDVIKYKKLNSFGLFSSHADAKRTQERLRRAYPDEEHADCVVVEIWRYIAE